MSFFVGVTGLKKKITNAMQNLISLIDEFYFLTKLDKDY